MVTLQSLFSVDRLKNYDYYLWNNPKNMKNHEEILSPLYIYCAIVKLHVEIKELIVDS